MRTLLVFLSLVLVACVEDAAPSESEDSNGDLDAGMSQMSDGSLEETDACLTDDWFCVEGAPDAAMCTSTNPSTGT